MASSVPSASTNPIWSATYPRLLATSLIILCSTSLMLEILLSEFIGDSSRKDLASLNEFWWLLILFIVSVYWIGVDIGVLIFSSEIESISEISCELFSPLVNLDTLCGFDLSWSLKEGYD